MNRKKIKRTENCMRKRVNEKREKKNNRQRLR